MTYETLQNLLHVPPPLFHTYPSICKFIFIVQNLLFLFLVVLLFKLRASHLLDRCSTTSVTPPALFCIG
jgi:hypothetical protein